MANADARSSGAVEAFKAIVASLAFFLAFTLSQAQSILTATDAVVAQEASAMNMMDDALIASVLQQRGFPRAPANAS